MAGVLQRLAYLFTGRLPAAKPSPSPYGFHAKVDAAQTTDDNKRHWANADSLSADAAYDSLTRSKLRNRSRYESLNNCYSKGVVKSAADDLIGTGPRLQLSIPGDMDGEQARRVERNYAAWADETQLAIHLRIAEKSRVRDGECFALFDTNNSLRNAVKFDLQWLEAEQCDTPFQLATDANVVDGVEVERGRPIAYYFLTEHPGGRQRNPLSRYTRVPAKNVIHWVSFDRFGQRRGIPETTPALPLYSQLRRYTLATLTAAEFAAMLAGVLKTAAPAEEGVDLSPEAWDLFEMVRGALLTLPGGTEAMQFRPEQPTATFPEFKRELLNECGRATNQPLNVVSGNSSGYNFSSGRLDHLPYQRSLRIQRTVDMRLMVLDRIFRDGWYPEAVGFGEVPEGLPPIAEWRWSWNWDGFDSIDQNKDANADDVRLKNGTATYAEILAEYGQNWVEVFEQLQREKAMCEKLGLPWPILSQSASAASSASANAPTDQVSPEDQQPTPPPARRPMPSRNGSGVHR